jgi:hypothetical protein
MGNQMSNVDTKINPIIYLPVCNLHELRSEHSFIDDKIEQIINRDGLFKVNTKSIEDMAFDTRSQQMSNPQMSKLQMSNPQMSKLQMSNPQTSKLQMSQFNVVNPIESYGESITDPVILRIHIEGQNSIETPVIYHQKGGKNHKSKKDDDTISDIFEVSENDDDDLFDEEELDELDELDDLFDKNDIFDDNNEDEEYFSGGSEHEYSLNSVHSDDLMDMINNGVQDSDSVFAEAARRHDMMKDNIRLDSSEREILGKHNLKYM